MGERIEFDRIIKLVGIAVIHTVDICRLENDIRINLRSAQGSRRICGKERVARAAAENDDPALFQMADGTVANIRLGNLLHRDCRLHPDRHLKLLQSICKRQRIHHGGEHPHVVRARAVHLAAGTATPEIAAADHQADLDAHVGARFNGLANILHRVKINAVPLRARKHFAAEF